MGGIRAALDGRARALDATAERPQHRPVPSRSPLVGRVVAYIDEPRRHCALHNLFRGEPQSFGLAAQRTVVVVLNIEFDGQLLGDGEHLLGVE